MSCVEKYRCDRCKKEMNKEDIFNKIEQNLKLDQFCIVKYEVDISSKLFIHEKQSNELIDFCKTCAREIFLEVVELLDPCSTPVKSHIYEYLAIYGDGTVEKRTLNSKITIQDVTNLRCIYYQIHKGPRYYLHIINDMHFIPGQFNAEDLLDQCIEHYLRIKNNLFIKGNIYEICIHNADTEELIIRMEVTGTQ